MIEKLRIFAGAVNEALERCCERASLMEIPGQCHSNCLVIHFYRDKERLPISNNAYWNRHPFWQRFYLLLKRLYRVDPLAIDSGQHITGLQSS